MGFGRIVGQFRGGDVGHPGPHDLGVHHLALAVAAGNRARDHVPEFVDLAPLDDSLVHRATEVAGFDGCLFRGVHDYLAGPFEGGFINLAGAPGGGPGPDQSGAVLEPSALDHRLHCSGDAENDVAIPHRVFIGGRC